MIHSSCQCLDDALHLQGEEEGWEASHLDVGLYGNDVDLQVVVLGEDIHDGLLFCREVGEETSLDALSLGLHQLRVVLPSHVLHEVGGTGEERGAIRADKVVAALAVAVAYPAREGEDVTIVGLRDFACDETSTMGGALYQDASIRHACHDAVAAHEVDFVGVRLGEKLGEQSSLLRHSASRLLVSGRVEVVQAMCKYAHRLISLVEGLSMRQDIYSVCQTAHNEYLRTELPEVAHEAADEVLAIRSAVASAHDVDDSLLVEVGIALVEEHERRIVAFLQTLGIAVVIHTDGFYAIA